MKTIKVVEAIVREGDREFVILFFPDEIDEMLANDSIGGC